MTAFVIAIVVLFAGVVFLGGCLVRMMMHAAEMDDTIYRLELELCEAQLLLTGAVAKRVAN